MLTRDNFIGPWAGLPVAWTDNDEFDESTYRRDVARCCEAGVPGVYTGGTSGEFYAQEWEEFQQIARATVEECHRAGKPAMIGCTSTSTRGAKRRAEFAREIAADAIQVALPFWMEVPDDQVVPFFLEVARAAAGLPLSVYETCRAKKALTLDQHRQIRELIPQYLMVKANAATVGCSEEGCHALSEFVNVFVSEDLWAQLGPQGAIGSCSAMVYWNPRIVLQMFEQLRKRNWSRLKEDCHLTTVMHQSLFATFGSRGFTDTAYDRLAGRTTGFLQTSLRNRGPYVSPRIEDIEVLRNIIQHDFPEMLQL